jgi:hypothetical protein
VAVGYSGRVVRWASSKVCGYCEEVIRCVGRETMAFRGGNGWLLGNGGVDDVVDGR